MLTIGFTLLIIAGICAVIGFGVFSTPVVGPARVAFYFLFILSLATIFYGVVQTEMHVDPRVPTQERN
ncbi:MAG: hypothetical protein NPIRA03_06050 [Nitrospirales bacterium]|nr:MAG: hypothetical protein NPIRA03_06050 [Nitrospirales bacterium]